MSSYIYFYIKPNENQYILVDYFSRSNKIYGYASNTGGTFNMTGGTIGNSSASNPAKDTAGYYSNYATSGGGIYADAKTSVSITGGSVDYNYATSGGGVYWNGETLSISGNSSHIDFNGASNGGGLYISSTTATATMTGGYFYSNSATSNGGAVYIKANAAFEMTGGTIGESNKFNTCGNSGYGGAIYNNGTFKLGGTAYIPGGSSSKINTIHLTLNKTIDLKSPLTTFSTKAKITLGSYNFMMQVVKPLSEVTDNNIYDACQSLSLAYNPYLLDLGDDGYTTVGFYFCTETTDISDYPNVSWSTNAITTNAATNKRRNRAFLIKIDNNTYAIGQLHFEPLNDDGERPLTFDYRVVNSAGQVNYSLSDSSACFGDGGFSLVTLSSNTTFGTPQNYYFHIEFTSNTNCEFSLGNLAQGLYAIPQ